MKHSASSHNSRMTRLHGGSQRRLSRPGVVLIIVLVVVVVVSLAAYTFSDLMLAHRRVTEVNGRRIQARMLAQSGVEAVKMFLLQDQATRTEAGGIYDNPVFFQGAVVIDDQTPLYRGSFSVLAPLLDPNDPSVAGVRYGLEDESARVNLNLVLKADSIQQGAGRTLLMALPGMTEDVADAILDWMDEDDVAREYGVEFDDYYSQLQPAYKPRNAPIQTVEELLLVAGVTPELLFGTDFNRNGIVDPHEETMSTSLGVGAGSTELAATDPALTEANRGWAPYLTLYSSEKNANVDGVPRININNDDLEALQAELSEVFNEEWTNFILAYRLYGASEDSGSGGNSGSNVTADTLDLDLSQQPKGQFTQVLDLIGARVAVPRVGSGGGDGAAGNQIVQSPFDNDVLTMASYMSTLMDTVTTIDAESIPGRININQAPYEILVGIPGMTEEVANQIVELRAEVTEADDSSRTVETWLLAEAVVTLEEMKNLLPFICAGGDVYRAQIVGYFQGGGPSARAEVVFDATAETPRVLFWRDISHLGRGYALETLGVDLVEALATQPTL